jgi:hypothetical protein
MRTQQQCYNSMANKRVNNYCWFTLCNHRAMVTTLLGMALANTGVLPPHPPELAAVYKFLLPLAIPMMLLSANLT